MSTYKSNLKFNEKLFISWVGPRGIVAAGIASLFGLRLAMNGEPGAEYITPLVFMIVLGTVLLNATTARFFAKVAGVFLESSNGIIIIGASEFSRLVGMYLKKNNRRVVLIDSNHKNINKAKEYGLEALEGNIFKYDLLENIELNDIGYLLALTSSSEVNEYAINTLGESFGEKGMFKLINPEELNNKNRDEISGLFSQTDDYLNLSEVARDYPQINEVELEDNTQFNKFLETVNEELHSIPLFLKDNNGFIHLIASLTSKFEIKKGNKFIYLGKKLNLK